MCLYVSHSYIAFFCALHAATWQIFCANSCLQLHSPWTQGRAGLVRDEHLDNVKTNTMKS